MTRRELELKINDAADGLLTKSERLKLEDELTRHPDLQQDYMDIMSLPDLSIVYSQDVEKFRNDIAVHRLMNMIHLDIESAVSFEDACVTWFRKYALAAALVILGITSLSSLIQPWMGINDEEVTMEELFYSYEESNTEAYVLYLDEISE